MTPLVTWTLFVAVLGLVVLMTAREVFLYRADRAVQDCLYPYTVQRLRRRIGISVLLAGEVVFLIPLRATLSPQKPMWFLIYVTIVIALAVAMIVLAWCDFRESDALHRVGKERLKKEFLQELQQDHSQPPLH